MRRTSWGMLGLGVVLSTAVAVRGQERPARGEGATLTITSLKEGAVVLKVKSPGQPAREMTLRRTPDGYFDMSKMGGTKSRRLVFHSTGPIDLGNFEGE